MVNQGSDVHSWTGAEIMQITQIDFDSHMEWGYWEQPNAMSINNIDHFIRNKGYYVWGDYTQNMPESGNYTYSGNAYGTYWTADGGVDMGPAEDVAGGTGGIFSADVNFSSGEVTNFELSVSGNDYSASISNGEGWIDNYTSKFQLGSGTYSINSNDDASGSAFGSFYGDDAADMGGVWQINNGSAHVTGSFVSTDKQGEAPR
jgi:hypothetical protein